MPGGSVLAVEQSGKVAIAGVTLTGKFDRIDRNPDGTLAIIDYKTGKAPSAAAVREGFSLQLGLLGLIAERGGFEDIAGIARAGSNIGRSPRMAMRSARCPLRSIRRGRWTRFCPRIS